MFYEDNNFLVASAAVIGFLIGAVVMWIYQWFKHRAQLKRYNEHISKQDATIELHELTKYRWISEIEELKGAIKDIKNLDQNIIQRQADYKKWNDKTKAEIERYFYLRTVVPKLEIKASIILAREERATKKAKIEQDRAMREERKKDTDKTIEELKKKSEGLSTTKPKGTPKQ